MGQLLMLAISLTGVALFALFVAAVTRWPVVVLASISAFVIIAWEFPATPAMLNAFGASVYPEDIVLAAAVAATILRPSRMIAVLRGMRPMLFVLLLVLAGSLVGGLAFFGPASINEARTFTYAIGITAWSVNQDWRAPEWERRLRRWVLFTGSALVVVMIFHIAMHGLGLSDTFVQSWLTGEIQTGRPLVASQALLLALCGLVAMRRTMWWKPRDKLFAGAFVIAVVLCQHRSVWVALIGAFVIMALFLRGEPLARLVVNCFWAALLGSIVLLSGVAASIVDSLSRSAQNLNTLGGREDTWSVLLQNLWAGELWGVLFGLPFGTGYARVTAEGFITYSPHNWYVTTILRLGLVGLVIFVVVMVSTFIRNLRHREVIAAAVIAAIMLYCWPYGISWFSCVIIGWAIALSASPEPDGSPAIRSTRRPVAAQRVD